MKYFTKFVMDQCHSSFTGYDTINITSPGDFRKKNHMNVHNMKIHQLLVHTIFDVFKVKKQNIVKNLQKLSKHSLKNKKIDSLSTI